MELLCALLTAFFLWLFMFHLLWSRRARVREEAGPLLLEVKAASRVVWAFRWLKWFAMAFFLVMMALLAAMLYRLSTAFPELVAWRCPSSPLSGLIISYSFMFLMLVAPPHWPRVALEIRERGIVFSNSRMRLWREIGECRWFLAKTIVGDLLLRWKPLYYRRSRVTVDEKNIAPGQKEAVTAMLARFAPVYDHDGTLLAEPSGAELAARAATPVRPRPRFLLQFDLRSLLLLVVVISCAASCYGIHYRRLLPQRRAVTRLEVFAPAIDSFDDVGIPWAIDFSKCAKKPSDDDLACLASLDQLTSVDLSGSPITDAGIEHLKGLCYLSYVNCKGTNVTAKGAEELHRLLPNAAIIYGPAKKPVVLKPPDWK